jgi:hypothetical protein
MKIQLSCLVLLAGCLPLSATPYRFGFSSSPGSAVVFDGDTDSFSFLPDGGGFDFDITTSDDGALDFHSGNIEGLFSIGAISIFESPFTILETASVSGLGLFSITDLLGHSIAADLEWVDIVTTKFKASDVSVGGVNTTGTVNLSNFSSYAGLDPRLLSFSGQPGTVTVSFQFSSPALSLSDLVTNGVVSSSSYSGQALIAVADSDPGMLSIVLGSLLVAFALVRNRIGAPSEA